MNKIGKNKIGDRCLTKYPPKMIKQDNCPGSMFDVLEQEIEDFIDNKKLSAVKIMNYIENNIEEFLQEIIDCNECGATLRIIIKNLDASKLTKENVYELMWSDNEIGARYGDSFEFDINDFGYEYFVWNQQYYLVSGIPA